MPHHLRYLTGFEYASGIKYARVLNMLRYSYNIIVVVTNIIILEFWSARFAHPGAPQPFYLFLLRVRT